jgi:hypothetical protein
MVAVADSILENLDRGWLAELIAYYLYLESKGEANFGRILGYAVSRRPKECAAIASSAAPALIAGILNDEYFRSAIISSLRSWIRGPSARDGQEQH